jgi:hypothetical protein
MEHLAILDKKRKLLAKVLSGEKTVESRWYMQRRAPWGVIKTGETIYFKESGGPVVVRARVAGVLQEELTPEKEAALVRRYGKAIGFSDDGLRDFIPRGKRYCILVFLEDVQRIAPFEIDKTGFGLMAAWITAPSIAALRKSS